MNFLHLIPLIKSYNLLFLTGNRARQYALLTHILENNIVHWKNVKFSPSVSEWTCDDLILLDFFADWCEGFFHVRTNFFLGCLVLFLDFIWMIPKFIILFSSFDLLQAVLVSQVEKKTIPLGSGSKNKKSKVDENICTDLIVWGTNLRSTVGYGRITKQVRDMIVLPPYQYSVIEGLLFSDGWFWSGSTNKSPRLELKQFWAHRKYQLTLSSRVDVPKVVNFFLSPDNYPLFGYKLEQYNLWLIALKGSSRYTQIKNPSEAHSNE